MEPSGGRKVGTVTSYFSYNTYHLNSNKSWNIHRVNYSAKFWPHNIPNGYDTYERIKWRVNSGNYKQRRRGLVRECYFNHVVLCSRVYVTPKMKVICRTCEKNYTNLCMISGFRRRVNEICLTLENGIDRLSRNNGNLTTIQRCVTSQNSEYLVC